MSSREEHALSPVPSPVGGRGAPEGRGEGLRRASATIREAARQHRREPTRSESILWAALRRKQLAGRKFRRQHPVGQFIIDFYCSDARLAVEIDGPIHSGRARADMERKAFLEASGIRFLRLPAWLIERDLPAALAAIEKALSPVPSPACGRGVPEGRGEGD